MKLYRDASIKTKVTCSMSIACAAVLLSFAAFAWSDGRMMKEHLLRQTSTLADSLAANSVTALLFQDRDVAGEVLSSVRLEPSIQFACTYDETGRVFARYGDPNELARPLTLPIDRGGVVLYGDGYIDIVKPIWHDQRQTGALLLRVGTKALNQQLWHHAFVFAAILAFAVVATIFTASWIHRAISRPIIHMAEAMHRVSTNNDYTFRVEKEADDEVGVLSDGFNGMLAQIERRDAEIHELNKQLAKSAQAAEAASAAKSEFLANMSHEIRTPITAILGFAELLDVVGDFTRDPVQVADAAQTIRRNADHLLTVINDILDMSKIEAGKMNVEHIQTNPSRIVEQAASLVRPGAKGEGIDVVVKYDTPIPEKIESDPTRLRQILLNLLGNAVKFTEVGTVTIHAAADPDRRLLRLSVVDTGIGMSPEQRDCVACFEAFSQADGSTTRKFGGTGLGLRIANTLAQLLGGKIEVESTLGEGSTFTMTVSTGDLAGVRMLKPNEIAEQATQVKRERTDDPGGKPLEGLRLLLAEDGPDNQRLISFILKKAGADVTLAENGQVAIDIVHGADNIGEPFDVILMDMQMPELDGYEATRQLRREGFTGPIVALTAHAMAEDRQKCLDAGCDEFASKPIDRKQLIELVRGYSQLAPLVPRATPI